MTDDLHVPVFLKDSIELMDIANNAVVIDATLWLWWHSEYILGHYPDSRVIWIDRDSDNISKAKERLEDFSDRFTIVKDNFSNIENIANDLDLCNKVDAILLDLGIASTHVDDSERWFSYQKDWPLDMRMDKDQIITAATIVNSYSEQDLFILFKKYWEEPQSRKIAKQICEDRKQKKIKTTYELIETIKKVKKDRTKHPWRLVFQALRIEVNDELSSIEKALSWSINILKKWWIIVVISYHSLEDRIVKNAFRYAEKECICANFLPICQCEKIKTLEIMTKKPMIPIDGEIERNPRSKSAKMRAARKII